MLQISLGCFEEKHRGILRRRVVRGNAPERPECPERPERTEALGTNAAQFECDQSSPPGGLENVS